MHPALRWLGVARDLFPLTPLGLAFAIGAYAALRAFAYAELDLVWLVTGYAALGLMLLAMVCVLPATLFVWIRLRRHRVQAHDTLRLETDRLTPTGYVLPSLRFMPFVQLRWEIVSPEASALELRPHGGELHEHVALRDRAHNTEFVRRVLVQDPFGLARIALRAPQARESVVLPHLGGLSQLPTLNAPAGGSELPHPMGLEDGDRLELSRYTPGDPARFIHWKAFARTRKLLVRRPERAIAIARRCAAFYIAGPDDDASAAVARLALERKLLGQEWMFGTDLAISGTSRLDEALAALVASSDPRARSAGGVGLAGFLAQADKRGPASVIVFGPAEPGPWLDAVARVAGRRQLRVVIGVDGVARERTAPRWLELFRSQERALGAQAELLDQVMIALGRARVQVTLLDRTTGRVLNELGRRALFRTAAASGAAHGSAA